MKAHRQPVRLAIVDDHPFVREGLRAYLEQRTDFIIVGEAADGPAALSLARRSRPDVVLMDVNLPKLSGLQATEHLRTKCPGVRVLMLTVHTQMEYVLQMIRAGAHGYVTKDAPPSELVRAITTVAQGGTHFSRAAAQAFLESQLATPQGEVVVSSAERLGRREREVLVLVAEGLTNKQMASRLGLSVRTVETHRERIRQKLGLRTVAELTRFVVDHGLMPARVQRRDRLVRSSPDKSSR